MTEPGTGVDLQELREFAGARIGRYKFPRQVDALPRNPTGKVLKTELRTRYA